jgi:hypothetical protein
MKFDQIIKISDLSIQINRTSVLSLLGYKRGKTKLSEPAGKVLEAAFKRAEGLIHPQGVYLIKRIKEKSHETITFINSQVFFRGKSISRLLSRSSAAALMAVTIGLKLEETIAQETQAGNLEKALALDVIGSEAAEAAAEALNVHLISLARQEKLLLTRRYSPGYGDFSLDNQSQLFHALSLEDLGISIDENFVLTPKKTITAVIGVIQ